VRRSAYRRESVTGIFCDENFARIGARECLHFKCFSGFELRFIERDAFERCRFAAVIRS
jgi:hypothetical protein